MQMGATEPLSHIVPELGFAQDAERLTGGVTLAPDIQEAGETQTGCGAEIVATPDEGKLQRDLVLQFVVRVGDILIEQLEIEDILIVVGMEAVVDAGEGSMVDGITAEVAYGIFVYTETTVVLQL
jgi:hypothetical protein